jgi:hypothetical protein
MWVKLGVNFAARTSASPLKADIRGQFGMSEKCPNPEVAASLDPSSTSRSKVAGTLAKRMAKEYFVPSFEARL